MMPKIKLFTIWPNIIIITQQRRLSIFKQINQAHWEAFQKNKLTKDEVLSHRFIEYFNHYGIEVDGKQADVTFRDELAKAPIKHFDSTLETIDRLAQNNKLYIVTNGVTDTQKDVSLNYNLKTYLMVYLYQRKPVIKSQ